MHDVPQKIITKDYTFEARFDATFFTYRKIIQKLKDGEYNLVGVETTWSIFRPFRVTVIAIIKEIRDIDLIEIRHNRSEAFLEKRRGNT